MARCDALVLLPNLNDVLHIPLPNFTLKDAHKLQQSLYSILKQKNMLRESDRAGRIAPTDSIDPEKEFEIILSELWNNIVRPILNGVPAITVCIYIML
jgi:hypothetical protein